MDVVPDQLRRIGVVREVVVAALVGGVADQEDQLAVALEGQGLTEEAREVYLRLAEEHPGSAYAAAAQRRGDLL